MTASTPPPITSGTTTPTTKACATVSLVAGLIAIPAVPVYAFIALFSSANYQNGEGSLLMPILGGMAGFAIHGAAAVAAILALKNKGPNGTAWAGLILNTVAALLVLLILFLISLA